MPIKQSDPHPLYASCLSPQERADLAGLLHADGLDGEIALLRILIRRHVAGPPIDKTLDGGVTMSVDVAKITRYIYTLCRAIKAHGSAGDRAVQERVSALDKMFEALASAMGLDSEPAEFVPISFADPPEFTRPNRTRCSSGGPNQSYK